VNSSLKPQQMSLYSSTEAISSLQKIWIWYHKILTSTWPHAWEQILLAFYFHCSAQDQRIASWKKNCL
jgi:hypothetical protein